jgi:hypothetical protein
MYVGVSNDDLSGVRARVGHRVNKHSAIEVHLTLCRVTLKPMETRSEEARSCQVRETNLRQGPASVSGLAQTLGHNGTTESRVGCQGKAQNIEKVESMEESLGRNECDGRRSA